MSNIMKDIRLNRAERRALGKKAEKETGKKPEELSVSDIMKTISADRKKNRRK